MPPDQFQGRSSLFFFFFICNRFRLVPEKLKENGWSTFYVPILLLNHRILILYPCIILTHCSSIRSLLLGKKFSSSSVNNTFLCHSWCRSLSMPNRRVQCCTPLTWRQWICSTREIMDQSLLLMTSKGNGLIILFKWLCFREFELIWHVFVLCRYCVSFHGLIENPKPLFMKDIWWEFLFSWWKMNGIYLLWVVSLI